MSRFAFPYCNATGGSILMTRTLRTSSTASAPSRPSSPSRRDS
ncbi:hypothetical protein Hanom_Chr07g00605161 [Helianthus anomalus]